MAVAFVKAHTIGTEKTSDTTLNVPVDTGGVPAGNLLVLALVTDNAATAFKPTISTITKPAGETATWTNITGALYNAAGTAGAFAGGILWGLKTTVAWPAGTYTVTLDTAVTQKAGRFIEFSGVERTLRNLAGAAYSTTTTAASASTGGTTGFVGDLAVGFLFGSNVAAPQAGDTDTTGGSWSSVIDVGSTGGSNATNNYGVFQYKVLTTVGTTQTFNNSAAMTAGNGAIVAVFQATPDPTITQAAYQWYDEGTESGSVALAAQDTAAVGDITNGDATGTLRIRLQSTTAVAVPSTDDWQLQYEKNVSGTWVNVSASSVAAATYDSPNLTNQAATTNRLTGGTGTFTAGKVSEDSLMDDLGWGGNNYTELVYALKIKATDVINGDTLRFRVLRNGATTGVTYTQVPTITITQSVATGGSATGTYLFARTAVSGAKVPQGSSTAGTYLWSGTATGTKTPRGTSTAGTYLWSGTATGQQPITPKVGTATGTYDWSRTTATGTKTPRGASTAGTYLFARTAATGTKTPRGTSTTGTYLFARTLATGTKTPRATSSGTYAYAGTATGLRPVVPPKTGTASGTYLFARSTATGYVLRRGTSTTGTYAYAGNAQGLAPAVGVKAGTAIGAYLWARTSVVGTRPTKGTATTGTYAWSRTTATGTRTPKATTTGTYVWARTTATGTKTPRGASTSGSYAYSGTATGKRPNGGTSTTGTYVWARTTATGVTTKRAAAVGAYAWSGTAVGVKPIPGVKQGTAQGTYLWARTSATGTKTPRATTSGAYAWSRTTATGSKTPGATSSGAYDWSRTSVTGTKTPRAAAVGGYAFTRTAASGVITRRGTSTTGTYRWTGNAQGQAPAVGVNAGTAIGGYLWARTTATGRKLPKASTSGTYLYVGTATGRTVQRSAAAGTYLYVGTAVGTSTGFVYVKDFAGHPLEVWSDGHRYRVQLT